MKVKLEPLKTVTKSQFKTFPDALIMDISFVIIRRMCNQYPWFHYGRDSDKQYQRSHAEYYYL